VRRLGLALAAVVSTDACGGTARLSATVAARDRPTMGPTPPAALALCQESRLLRPICPRTVPRAAFGSGGQRWLALCASTHGKGGAVPLTSHRCVEADWSYEASGPLPGLTARARLAGWDGKRWLAISAEAGMEPPPVHIHVDIAASTGTPPVAVGTAGSPAGLHRASDALLNPARTNAVSLGWVRWYDHHGQLVLAPLYPTGAEWGGHLFFEYAARGISYAVTLHAWFPRLRISTGRRTRVFRFEPGASLPRVIATLKTIVGSTPGR
jgi:hypothetical protein